MTKIRFLCAIASGASLVLHPCMVGAQELIKTNETVIEQAQPLPPKQNPTATNDAYILGPGDALQIELLDLPELSGDFSIGPDGALYLPRLRTLYVEGLTVEELRYLLTEKFSTYVHDPQVYVRTLVYRPIRIYVSGEVTRPGFYTLTGAQRSIDDVSSSDVQQVDLGNSALGIVNSTRRTSNGLIAATLFPTVFDAIRTAQGITPFSNLSKVYITRKRAAAFGGGRIRTSLDVLSLITEGNDSQNIRLFDGDVVRVSKSNVVIKDQLRIAGRTNLTPQFMNVFLSGRIKNPGSVVVPQGSSLNQAITVAGGIKILRGKVEFIRFTSEGAVERSLFTYNPSAAADTPSNPVLVAGDLINIRESVLTKATTLMNELTAPALGAYSAYSLLRAFD